MGGALWEGRVDDALATLTGLRGAEPVEPLEAAIRYVGGQRGWIGDYGAWREQGLPIDSGLVERQVELVINRRASAAGCAGSGRTSAPWWRCGCANSTWTGSGQTPSPISQPSPHLLVEPRASSSPARRRFESAGEVRCGFAPALKWTCEA